ncbi:hypothetical protein PW52_15510 [Tamlana sedimentorum]|uniref:DUF4890 domain-containing protein n=1 Tax=Neotamlana sedimentorum TaxID=1435349 RepID=A0A0D7W1R1_9FLAO|nr:hypothetical protein [Tamlana sedimentorum]KJD32643.1 hypothetical protein PW52_15510 [Tamlana sedimentorum]
MKKILLIAIALVGLQAVAQNHRGEGKKERGDKMANLSAEEIATLQTKRMTLYLDLTESQQKKIQAINLENATKRKEMMEERKAKKESGEERTKPTDEERLAMENARLDHKIAMKAKMKDILNEEQYTKWEKSQQRMAMRGKKNKDDSKKNRKQKS